MAVCPILPTSFLQCDGRLSQSPRAILGMRWPSVPVSLRHYCDVVAVCHTLPKPSLRCDGCLSQSPQVILAMWCLFVPLSLAMRWLFVPFSPSHSCNAMAVCHALPKSLLQCDGCLPNSPHVVLGMRLPFVRLSLSYSCDAMAACPILPKPFLG